MAFILEKLLSRLLFPVPLLLIMLVAGWLLWIRFRRTRLAGALMGLAILMFGLMSLEPLADRVLRTLEGRHEVLLDRPNGVAHVVVLGAGSDYVAGVPASINLTSTARSRLIEGIRLLLQGSDPGVLVFTGDAGAAPVPIAAIGAEAAEILGVPRERMMVLDSPRNTREEAEAVVGLVGERPFVLVTSASHLPRAMAECRRAGGNPIAAPAEFLARRAQHARSPWNWIPNASAIMKTERAVYEYLGLLRLWVGSGG